MSVAISWTNKKQLAKCDIMVGFPISSHIYVHLYVCTMKLTKVCSTYSMYIHIVTILLFMTITIKVYFNLHAVTLASVISSDIF